MSKQGNITIVGAGLGGIMMAIRAAQRGETVEVYERRPQVDQTYLGQRSFTLTLSKRGLQALDEIGLRQATLALTTPLRGRLVHNRDGSTVYLPYGVTADEQIYLIRRHEMNALLYQKAQEYPNIRFHFQQRLVRLEKESNLLWFADEQAAGASVGPVAAGLVIGGDGAFSAVRQQMQKGERADFQQEFLDWGYKDILITAAPHHRQTLATNVLHLWPRGHCTFFVFPNLDGSYAGNFIGPCDLLEKLQSAEAAQALLAQEFADLLAVAPTLPQQLLTVPISYFLTVRTAPWHYRDKIVLLGDAAHAVPPFWGEGMNAAFEDTSTLDRCLVEHLADRRLALATYQALRKPNTDMLAHLSKQNFIELRDTTAAPKVVARKLIERKLYQTFPNHWLPLNIMIAHRLMPYVAAAERDRRQQKVARYCGINLVVWLLALWFTIQPWDAQAVQTLGSFGASLANNATGTLALPQQSDKR